MFGRRAKCKREPGVDLTVASHLEFVVIAYGQEPIDCQGFNAVCAASVNALLKHFNLDDDKDFLRDVALLSWLGLKDVGRHCSRGWLLPRGCVGRRKKKRKEKQISCLYLPGGGDCSEWSDGVHMREGLDEPHK